MYFDSHAHYDDKKYKDDRQSVIEALKAGNVSCVINAGASIASSKRSIELAEKYDFIYAAVGIHPHSAKDMLPTDIGTLRSLAQHKKVVALGEMGLDYYHNFSPANEQAVCFARQLKLAKELDMPVIIHSRDAAQPVFDMIKDSGVNKGVIHSYSGSAEMALDYVKLGYYIGISGVLTYKTADKLVRVVDEVPLEHLLIETDAPYLSPVPHRGERNSSVYLKYVVRKIAAIKGISEAEAAEVTSNNAKRLFFKSV
ncbi:MAG: TatD family hydrolase [Defluviitaleaceae bacterium]|nr:TatD family hydrolase [Defluviitaleaceae bacterium]